MPTTKKTTNKVPAKSKKTPVATKKTITSRSKKSVISTGISKANGVEKSPILKGDLSTSSRGRSNNTGLSNSAVMGLLHLVGGVLGSRGWLAVIIYYIAKKESFSAQDTDIFYNIVNFNLSFLLYGIISAMLVVILIGIPMLAIVTVTYVVLLIISSFNYISDKSYKIPFSIQILK